MSSHPTPAGRRATGDPGVGPRVLKALAALLVGTSVGLVTADLTSTGQPWFGAARSGAWTAWPGGGGIQVDPYARAVFARDGRVPLAVATGLSFLATRDDSGARLDRRCEYEVSGPTPQAQFWTLTPLDPAGYPLKAGEPGAALTSSEVVRDATGQAVVTVAAAVRPGNWLPVSGEGPFILMLTFYDTPLTGILGTGAAPPPLPAIDRRSCR